MDRIHLVGMSGAGKSTFARALSVRLGLPHLELDAIHHQANWTPLESGEFRNRVEEFCSSSRWVVCGNYPQVRDLIWARADTIIWLDFPRWRIMSQILRRSLKRVVFRESLWNGNRETWGTLLSLDPQKSVILWAWTRHGSARDLYEREFSRLTSLGVSCVRLRTPAEVRDWLVQVRS